MYANNITNAACCPTRRALLVSAASTVAGLFCGASGPARADDRKIVVITSFPEELTTRYEQEFEKKFPGAHAQFIWKQSRDALAELSKPDQGGADVYWAPSLGNFPILRDRGAFLTYLRPVNPCSTKIAFAAGLFRKSRNFAGDSPLALAVSATG